MDDLISRQAAIDAIIAILGDKTARHNGWIDPYYAVQRIKGLPSADVPDRKVGEWIGIDDYPYESWECDQCGCVYEEMPSWVPNYCPNCGAQMKGEE